MDIVRFLAEHSPFDTLEPALLQLVAAQARIEFFPEGSIGATAVGSLIRRPPIACDERTTVAEASQLMARERASSVLVPHPRI